MTREEFEQLIEEEFPNAIPEKFRPHIKNVAFLVEDEPSAEVRKNEGLGPNETLLGLYQGIPYPMRGDWYGMGATMPDTITLYQKPIEEEASELSHSNILQNDRMTYENYLRRIIRETIWHEVAHLFGMDEHTVRRREDLRDGGSI
ncbi:MAG: metallopeptidase family protein [Patescibacteria group bacterium]